MPTPRPPASSPPRGELPSDCPAGFTMYEDGPQPYQDIEKKKVFWRKQKKIATCVRCSDENLISEVCSCDACYKILCLFCAYKHYCRTLGQSMNPDHRPRGGKPAKRTKDAQPTYTQEEWENYEWGNTTHEGAYSASSNEKPPEFAAFEERIKAEHEMSGRVQDLGNKFREKQLEFLDAKRMIASLEHQVRDLKNEVNRLQRMLALRKHVPPKEVKQELESRSRSRAPRRCQSPPPTQGKLQRSRREPSSSPRRRRSRSTS